jgi:SAM-dependent methyltransferase
MSGADVIDRFNRAAYSRRKTVRSYSGLPIGLFEAERVILERLRPELEGRKLLDIGVGGGRTTPAILSISSDYTAIDYSAGMAERVRNCWPEIDVYWLDVRKMKPFVADTFDFALFSFNGLDLMNHSDRLQAMNEIHRVLKPGGIFVFSSHNRDGDAARPAWRRRNVRLSMQFSKECIKTILWSPRHLWRRRFEAHEEEYAILNDSSLHYSALTYYISLGAQKKQLESVGYTAIEAFDANGTRVEDDSTSLWIHYLARKPGATVAETPPSGPHA